MADPLKVRDIKDVETAVRWAVAENKSLEVVGRGSKRSLGRPAQWDATLDLSALNGVTMYEPEELVLTAHAGTPLREIESQVDGSNQELAFEPMDYGPLLGLPGGRGSIGGALAANLSGPRRIKAGAARDHFLGFTAVSGRGEIFKSGGRVVKNVTGYDLCKLVAGSWGTLAAMTEVTIKVLPRAETEMTLAVLGLVDAGAMKAMAAATGSASDVSGAAHLPGRVASQLLPGSGAGKSATVFRLEGVEPSVVHRARVLSELMKSYGPLAMIDHSRSRMLWRAIRDVTPFGADGPVGTYPVWRISTAPTDGAELARLISEDIEAEFIFDWAGGLIWAVLAPSDDAGEAIVRAATTISGGHATLVRAPAAIRATVPVFAPEEGALAALTARVKESFDPQGVLNPGRMWAGYLMQTNFSLAQLADPDVAEADKIFRACVHCGFCTATCPTYLLLGDELDSPRGRIYLIKDMLENDRPASKEVVTHIDRCLSCLSCMTTCPSGVHYMHLVDHARAHIEETYSRPIGDRVLRAMLAFLMPRPRLFRIPLLLGILAKPFAPLLKMLGMKRVAAMLQLVPGKIPPHPPEQGRVTIAQGERKARVALLTGCVAPVLSPDINEAAERVLSRHGIEVVFPAGEGCCGSLAHHMGRENEALAMVRANVDAWIAEIERSGLDAILVTASGCGTTIKDYGFMLRNDPTYAEKAAKVSGLARDISEYLATVTLQTTENPPALNVAYHAACSLAHGQKITRQPKQILLDVGFAVQEIPEGHICCGSAGTYNILQPELAGQLRDRKIRNIERIKPDVIAGGNIGCLTQIAAGTAIPVVHPVELVDWATGGPRPAVLERTISTELLQ